MSRRRRTCRASNAVDSTETVVERSERKEPRASCRSVGQHAPPASVFVRPRQRPQDSCTSRLLALALQRGVQPLRPLASPSARSRRPAGQMSRSRGPRGTRGSFARSTKREQRVEQQARGAKVPPDRRHRFRKRVPTPFTPRQRGVLSSLPCPPVRLRCLAVSRWPATTFPLHRGSEGDSMRNGYVPSFGPLDSTQLDLAVPTVS